MIICCGYDAYIRVDVLYMLRHVFFMQLQQVISMMQDYVNEFHGGWNRYEHGYFEQLPDIDYILYTLFILKNNTVCTSIPGDCAFTQRKLKSPQHY